MTIEKLRQLKAGKPQEVTSVRELYSLVKLAEAWDYIKSWADDEGVELDPKTFNKAVESLASEVGLEWVETADFESWWRSEGKRLLLKVRHYNPAPIGGEMNS